MARRYIKNEGVMESIPQEHKALVEAIRVAQKWGMVCADETGVTVRHTALSLTPKFKEQFENNADLEALGMKFVKPENKVGHWELDF